MAVQWVEWSVDSLVDESAATKAVAMVDATVERTAVMMVDGRVDPMASKSAEETAD